MNRKNDILYCYPDNGICLYETVEINGIKQYTQIRGADKTAPLMLFLHGGPGGSMAGLCHVMQSEWEKHFTVVNWDQRNTCKTYLANKSIAGKIAKTGSISDYMSDIDAVIAYLHTVYDFGKIIIAGFSWGSLIGAEYAKMHSENVSCYIGIGQHIHYLDGLRYSCEWLKDMAKNSITDTIKIQTFEESIPTSPEMTLDFLKVLQGFSILGAKYIAKDAKSFPLKALLTSPFLNFSEKMSMLRSDYRLLSGSYRTLMTHDFRDNLHFDIPVLFISGDEDFVCPNKLIAECFDDISAPKKQNEVISKATHLCFYDQPDAFLTEIIKFTNSVAS